MEIAWWLLLGALLAGYFVLGGYDYGAQMLTAVIGRHDAGRRTVLGALGPFVLGNEVWLVAVAGVLFGAFPLVEGVLLVGLFPLLVLLLLGLVVGNAAVQLRSRVASPGRRRLADALVVAGGVLPAVLWGMVLGVLLGGVELRADGYFLLGADELADPLVLACGVASLGLFAAHGACFLALRGAGELGRRARGCARVLLPVAVVAALPAIVLGVSRAAVPNPGPALVVAAVLVSALLVASAATTARRPGVAFAASSTAAAAPVVLLGVAQFPFVLVSSAPVPSVTVAAAASDAATLRVLSAVAVVAVPVIVAYQLWSWWVMRGRVDEHSVGYH